MSIGNNGNKISVAIVHLIWLPYGIEWFQYFISSYKKFASGFPHNLVLLFNGVMNKDDTNAYHEYALQQGLVYDSYYREKGQDLEVYFWIARQLSVEYVLFLNSYSILLSQNWLYKYMNIVIKEKRIGVISATGSYQSYYSSLLYENSWRWEKDNSFRVNWRKYKLLIKTIFFYRFCFKPFPNPHIRTNAFLINKELFLSLKFKVPEDKFRAYQFESGRTGLTNQLLRKNLRVLIVDVFGNFYEMTNWYQSRTFWTSNQENLLVSDNQTGIYQDATSAERAKMSYNAWRVYE